ncbi:hypothetical protein CVT26_015288 [Gymnopilus dilepis]|uniref:Uncharacterized protein n=1 Tax=Gymnopilus dilepis TaxID=231916 RepID=A0A409X796_9AGAR|nr:hypothetical protein CVT26_015288 [Gymnopilus dilepis]
MPELLGLASKARGPHHVPEVWNRCDLGLSRELPQHVSTLGPQFRAQPGLPSLGCARLRVGSESHGWPRMRLRGLHVRGHSSHPSFFPPTSNSPLSPHTIPSPPRRTPTPPTPWSPSAHANAPTPPTPLPAAPATHATHPRQPTRKRRRSSGTGGEGPQKRGRQDDDDDSQGDDDDDDDDVNDDDAGGHDDPDNDHQPPQGAHLRTSLGVGGSTRTGPSGRWKRQGARRQGRAGRVGEEARRAGRAPNEAGARAYEEGGHDSVPRRPGRPRRVRRGRALAFPFGYDPVRPASAAI